MASEPGEIQEPRRAGALLEVLRDAQVNPANRCFGYVEMSELTGARPIDPAVPRYTPLMIFGSTLDGRELQSDILIRPESIRQSPARLTACLEVVRGGLEHLAALRRAAGGTFMQWREQAVEACRKEEYEALAGIIVGQTAEQRAVTYYFHAKPLQGAAFALRERVLAAELWGKRGVDFGPDPEANTLGEVVELPLDPKNPTDYTYRMVGTIMGSLLLPAAIGKPIDNL